MPGWLPLGAAALVAASARAEPPGSPGVEWDQPVLVASGPARQGPWRMNASEFHFVDDPTVLVDGRGDVAVAWVDQTRKDVVFQSYARDGAPRHPAPVNVSRTPEVFSWLPRMAVARTDPDRLHVLWQEIVFSGGTHGGEIFHARSRDGGKTFDAPRNLSRSRAGDGKGRLTRRYWHNGSLDLAAAPDGSVYAAWTEYEGALWFSRSADAGESFSEPLRVAGGNGAAPARGPAIAVAPGGVVHLAWTVGEDPGADIHLASSHDAGRSFGAARRAVDSGGHSDAPKIAVDGAGTIHLVYAESPRGPMQRYHVRHTRSRDGGRTFARPRAISDPLPEGFHGAAFPALDIDADDRVYVIWELFSGAGARPRGLGFTRSGDAGRTFATPSVVPGSADPALGTGGGRQGLLARKLAVGASGTVAVVHSTFRRGESSHVWLYRGRRRGSASPVPR